MVLEKRRQWCCFENERCFPTTHLIGFAASFTACSNWEEFEKMCPEAEKMLLNNQYPKQLILKIVNSTLSKINSNGQWKYQNNISKITSPTRKHWLSLEYRRKLSENFAFKLRKILPSVNIVFTTSKLKNYSPKPEKRRSVSPEVSCRSLNFVY